MIYVLEDDDNIRKLISYSLQKDGFEVEGFSLPSTFWAALEEATPDLVLLDLMLPEEDGLSILKKIKDRVQTQDIPVIIVSARDSEFDTVNGLELGADDYIAKPFSMIELSARVHAVLRRFHKVSSHLLTWDGGLVVDLHKRQVSVHHESIDLSYKEFELLVMLLKADGNVVSRSELLASIWGEFYDNSRTLDVHIRKLRKKLGLVLDIDIINTVKSVGYQVVHHA